MSSSANQGMGESFLTGLLRILEGWIWRRYSQTHSRQLAKGRLSRRSTAGVWQGEPSATHFFRGWEMAGPLLGRAVQWGWLASPCLTMLTLEPERRHQARLGSS